MTDSVDELTDFKKPVDVDIRAQKAAREMQDLAAVFSPNAPIDQLQRAFDTVFFGWKRGWLTAFWLMLVMATGIASLGLSENSAAVVIGAMVVAPLGTPIIALGAAIAIGWIRQIINLMMLIAIGAASVVAIAFLLGLILPQAIPNEQILARTTPDFRDFGIALFAGVAGTYGYYRKEFSSVLAGVAIAVALIPPLCVVGLMLEEGRYVLAHGGFILFLTNLSGISLGAVFVSFAMGAVEFKLLIHKRVVFSLVLCLVGVVAVMIPLSVNYDRIVNPAAQTAKYYSNISLVLRQYPGQVTLQSLKVDGDLANIIVKDRGGKVQDIEKLQSKLQDALNLQVDVVDMNAAPKTPST